MNQISRQNSIQKLNSYTKELVKLFPKCVKDTIKKVSNDRYHLAVRGYSRAMDNKKSIESRWAWTGQEITQHPKTVEGRAMQKEINSIISYFNRKCALDKKKKRL